MPIYELGPRKILGIEFGTTTTRLAPTGMTYSFDQNHGTGANPEIHELFAKITNNDFARVQRVNERGVLCVKCIDQVGFKSKLQINGIPGLNERLRWVEK